MGEKKEKEETSKSNRHIKTMMIVVSACVALVAVIAGVLISASPEGNSHSEATDVSDVAFANNNLSDMGRDGNVITDANISAGENNTNASGGTSDDATGNIGNVIEEAMASAVDEMTAGSANATSDTVSSEATNTQTREFQGESAAGASSFAASNENVSRVTDKQPANNRATSSNPQSQTPARSQSSSSTAAKTSPSPHVHSWKNYETMVKQGYYDTVDMGSSRKMVYVYGSDGNVMNQFLPANRADAERWAARYGCTDIREVDVPNTCTLWYSPVYEYGKKCACGAKQVEGTRGGNSTTIAGHV